jgi:hypothetical protein
MIEVSPIVTALAPVAAAGGLMLFWGKWDWSVVAVVGLVSAPLYFVTRSRLRIDDRLQ